MHEKATLYTRKRYALAPFLYNCPLVAHVLVIKIIVYFYYFNKF